MNGMAVRKISCDPGHNGTRVAEVQSDQIITAMVDSVVGVGSMDTGALNLAGVSSRNSRRGPKPLAVAFDGIEYLVGAGVSGYARPQERMDFARFTDGPELRALLYASLYQLLNGGSHSLALAITLPVQVLADADTAAHTEREMSKWLIGTHSFTLDGTLVEFEIVSVQARTAQPVATWLDWGLDLEGKWSRGKEAMLSPVCIIDEGFNTIDVLVVEGGRINPRYTAGETMGMRRAAELASTNLQRRYGVELSLHEADDLVQAIGAGNRASIYVEGESTDVTADVRQALNALGADVLRFVDRVIGNGKQFKILITGGGGQALATKLTNRYPHAVLVPDPVLANARGLAKAAQRTGFFSGLDSK
jgi:hypothetical protein